jgi:putative tryptophan/tyrosine transport system substrate-binding protein
VKRRTFITLLGGAVAVFSLAARGQQLAMPVIGFLSNSSRQLDESLRLAFVRQGLREAGYVEGRNAISEYRGAEDSYDRLPEVTVQLLRLRPAVVVTLGGPTVALAAKNATTTVPIVFSVAGDPVRLGLVASLNRPGGNITGWATLTDVVVAKQFEALHEAIPAATAFGCLLNPNNPNTETDIRAAQDAGRALGLKVQILLARNEAEIETAFARLVQTGAGGLVVVSDGFFNSRPEQFAALALQRRIPTVYSLREFARAGGLMSYGTSVNEAYRQVGVYAGRILNGEKPADLPVIQATKVELIINMMTAKALGITFPFTLLGRSDEVIE